ncbi:MAG: hypothetical protein HGA80_05360 [Candidatus Omnitrophica bacterium]|nr:hypothetical protein [Candidatus Omnitrophota bacterium]
MQPTPKPVLQRPLGLLIEPQDTLFFRDGRPFGPTDFACSQFPMPQTVAGMLRTHLMHTLDLKSSQMHNLRNNADMSLCRRALAFIACRGPWLTRPGKDGKMELFVPPPANLYRVNKDKDCRQVLLSPSDKDLPGWTPNRSDLRPLLPPKGENAAEPETRWLGPRAVSAVLQGKVPEHEDMVCPDKLFTWEERTGVSISPDTGTGENGLIYSTRQMRLQKNIALYAEIGWEAGVPDEVKAAFDAWGGWDKFFPQNGVLLPFGGEGRRVLVRKADRPFEWPCCTADTAQRAFTWLISPVIFYQHERTSGTRLPWEPMSCGKLVGATCPRPLAVSGWDMAGDEAGRWISCPRPTRYAVPAGAVYFWERGKHADQDKPFIAGETLIQLAESAKDRANGWGLALKGQW